MGSLFDSLAFRVLCLLFIRLNGGNGGRTSKAPFVFGGPCGMRPPNFSLIGPPYSNTPRLRARPTTWGRASNRCRRGAEEGGGEFSRAELRLREARHSSSASQAGGPRGWMGRGGFGGVLEKRCGEDAPIGHMTCAKRKVERRLRIYMF